MPKYMIQIKAVSKSTSVLRFEDDVVFFEATDDNAAAEEARKTLRGWRRKKDFRKGIDMRGAKYRLRRLTRIILPK